MDVLRNDAATGRSVRIRVLDAKGSDDLGALVRGTVDGRRITRVVKTGGSFFSASDPAVHFGLGDVPAGEVRAVRPG